jgi:hypothetical protein
MGLNRRIFAVITLSAALLSACASERDLELLRQPSMPPVAVAKASAAGPFYRSISIQDVAGTPEFRWFDGDGVFNTRLTRVQAIKILRDELTRADMLAPKRIDSKYMLYVRFDDLRGPDVWIGSDKLASAKITFRLVEWRTGRLIKEYSVEASYRARWAGVTPDMVRAAIAGPIAVTKDYPFAPVGGLAGGLVVGYYVNENLVVKIADAKLAALESAQQAELIGGPSQTPGAFEAALATGLAIGTARGRFTDFEAMLAGGAISAVGAGAGPVEPTRPVASNEEIGALDGSARRMAASRGLLDLAFDEFMQNLRKDGSVVYKQAVSCDALNPNGVRSAYLEETETAYAVDCPGSRYDYPGSRYNYNESKTERVFPSHF